MKSIEERLEAIEKHLGIKQYDKPDWYYKGGFTTYNPKHDPEVTCWHCKKTFLCDCMDATCRMCGAPYAKDRCKEFGFVPKEEPKKSLGQLLHEHFYEDDPSWTMTPDKYRRDWERIASRAKELILDVDKEKLAEVISMCGRFASRDVIADHVIEFLKAEAEKL